MFLIHYLVRSLHDGMQAQVTADGQVAPMFEVRNGAQTRMCAGTHTI